MTHLQVVPGYYLRRNNDGFIENSTCMNNTASEHFMVERLIIDDLLCWAVAYKVLLMIFTLAILGSMQEASPKFHFFGFYNTSLGMCANVMNSAIF